jgi:predicted nucleic acid-binding protein
LKVLIDSNVLVAALDQDHVHFAPSALLIERVRHSAVIATHSLAEAYNHLTRERPIGPVASPALVTTAVRTLAAASICRALNHDETVTAIDSFAKQGGRGARLYDYLIGQVAILEQVDALATWNVRHFTALFPTLRVLTPADYLETF